MKFKKREITLNEADSLHDVFCLEEYLEKAYEEGSRFSFRKETLNVLSTLGQTAGKEKERAFSLWNKSKARQL